MFVLKSNKDYDYDIYLSIYLSIDGIFVQNKFTVSMSASFFRLPSLSVPSAVLQLDHRLSPGVAA